MILGKIVGKVTTTHFTFEAEKETKKFEYLQIMHKEYDYVLCQTLEIEKTNDKVIANCAVIGYKDDSGIIKPIRIPFTPGTEVLKAEEEFIKTIIQLKDDVKSAFIGRLDGKNIDVKINLAEMMTKHVCVLAKSGAGKSYTVGVLLEEIMDKKVPLLIIDPHGEYSDLKHPNIAEKEKLARFGLEPKGFKNIKEYGDSNLNNKLMPLRLNENLSSGELIHLIPGKLSGTQLGILYSALKHIDPINFTNVLLELDSEENNAKWSMFNNIEYLNNLNLFSSSFTSYNELIKSGECSIINLKGISPDVQEIIVYKLLSDAFELRKKNQIPPFFCVIEEAHNYCPERSFGETKCSKVIRTIASEGRKFGLGLCVVSQRPARVDKSVLSQCTTQIILKVTNPNDLRAISNSVEGITSETESELINLPIGTSLVAGITDIPLLVDVRPRMTKHGGEAVDIIGEEEKDIMEKVDEFQEQEILPIIKPKTSINDLKLMSDEPIEYSVKLIPSYIISCDDKGKKLNLLIDGTTGNVIVDIETYKTKKIPDLKSISKDELQILMQTYKKKIINISNSLVDNLVKKGLLEKTIAGYKLSEDYLFSKLTSAENYSELKYESVDYNEKLEKTINIEEIKKLLKGLIKIEDTKECHVIKYEIIN